MSSLVMGRIPAFTKCPFAGKCPSAKSGKCHHQGETHPVPFSCASARAFDMLEDKPKLPGKKNKGWVD